MDVLVAYDIETITPAGQRRLANVAKTCESYGIRVQFSVFECRLSETMLAKLTARLLAILDPEVDSVRIYRLPGSVEQCLTILGRQSARRLGEHWIL